MHFEDKNTNLEKIQYCQKIVDEIQAQNKQPVCPLQLSHESFHITDSHLGGTPYLPHNVDYPKGDDGQMLWMCAQINFAQMPLMDGFPREGILQFFLSDFDYDGGFGLYQEDDGTIQGQWRILYHPSIDENITDFLPIEQEKINQDDFRFDLFFKAAMTTYLPTLDPCDYMPYRLRDKTPIELESLQKIRKQINIGGCKIGGYPSYCQDDPRLYSTELGKPLEEWDTLLFQLDDDTFTFPVGDIGDIDLGLNGGTLNFLIRSNDLKNRDFSQVLAQWACT